jgi:hypothetical protein
MSNSNMLIPDKIKVGYQTRNGTYTGKLAYVIYFDNKGVLRKEKSWEGWRDKKIPPQELLNTPIEGFVLNKGVGGVRDSWSSWNTRNEYIRVYDPRDFEFEISVSNLLFILQESSSIKGKGLEGEFVYAWNSTELVLLPVCSEEYQSCQVHTARQSKKVVAKDVKAGFSYIKKNGTNVLYLGKYPYNDQNWRGFNPVGNKHIFLNLDDPNPKYGSPYIIDTGFTKLAEQVSSTSLPTYPDELDRFKNSEFWGEINNFELTQIPTPNLSNLNGSFIIGTDSGYYIAWIKKTYYRSYEFTLRKSITFKPEIKNNSLILPQISDIEQPINSYDIAKLKFFSLKLITPNGSKIEQRI